jgi:hypothetical protein
VLNNYRRIEDWHGVPDPDCRGTGGLFYVEPAPDPHPITPQRSTAHSVGIPTFENQNGRMMEAPVALRSSMCGPVAPCVIIGERAQKSSIQVERTL